MKKINKRKVLIALDYNPTAKKVAETGFSMAKSMNAEIILLHVISDPIYYSSPEYSPIMGFNDNFVLGAMQYNNVDELKKASQYFLDKFKQNLGDANIKTIVKDGDFADSILETAKEEHADIIVIGSHSRKWLENIVMGSVTEEVLHHTSIPLFIVPTRQKK
jgi:nucleotide-binding universal stress UspA family protein